jgi:hypothetical protein
LVVVAVVAVSPSALAFSLIPKAHDAGGAVFVIIIAAIWAGFVALCYYLINTALDKANAALRFTTEHVERRTVATEQHVDAETIGHVATAGKLADESDTARKWTTKTDAFGRTVRDDDDGELS